MIIRTISWLKDSSKHYKKVLITQQIQKVSTDRQTWRRLNRLKLWVFENLLLSLIHEKKKKDNCKDWSNNVNGRWLEHFDWPIPVFISFIRKITKMKYYSGRKWRSKRFYFKKHKIAEKQIKVCYILNIVAKNRSVITVINGQRLKDP